ncbi:hypothetical protein D9758_010208 [Tetrapyrgos nigripes]|uniref:Uncharacterized protein n=1 Tax=Tetrapyrgos nigripes TaxID=182062 RepID=A0A8H5CXM3_9AGAR|nr:hypothetical protein D9758_010208 [Tetrapyrgos nigripes]
MSPSPLTIPSLRAIAGVSAYQQPQVRQLLPRPRYSFSPTSNGASNYAYWMTKTSMRKERHHRKVSRLYGEIRTQESTASEPSPASSVQCLHRSQAHGAMIVMHTSPTLHQSSLCFMPSTSPALGTVSLRFLGLYATANTTPTAPECLNLLQNEYGLPPHQNVELNTYAPTRFRLDWNASGFVSEVYWG